MKENHFYQRQMILKEIGDFGQAKLKNARVLIVGAGGLGHPVASYLAASGIGSIRICDDDKVELSNLHRQVLFTPENCGKNKAQVLAARISQQNPLIKIEVLSKRITAFNITENLQQIDVVVDCCDNFATKFLLHDSAYFFKKDLVQASIYQFEGQLQVFPFKSGGTKQGCLRCLWPKTPVAGCVGSCAQAGVIGAVAGTLGSLQAMEVVKLICEFGESSVLTTKTINLLNLQIDALKWQRSNSCVLCGDNPSIVDLSEFELKLWAVPEVSTLNLPHHHYIDLREQNEIDSMRVDIKFEHLPFKKYDSWCEQISRDEKVVFYCQSGIRSQVVVRRLHSLGHNNCLSLKGGLHDLA